MESESIIGRRILVVDDDEIFYEMVHYFLSQKSIILQHAPTLEDAEQLLVNNDFDLILLDNFLPDGFGVQLMSFLHQHGLSMPVLMISADDNQSSMQKCFLNGVNDYLIKPINLDLLWLKIQRNYRAYEAEQLLHLQKLQLERMIEEQQQEELLARHVYKHLSQTSDEHNAAIRSYLKSSSAFNGDFFMSGQSPSGNHIMILVDATGHGLAAAISVLPFVSSLKTMLLKGMSLANIVHEINKKLCQDLPDDRFLAAIGVEVDYQSQRVSVFNAGMPDVLLVDNNCNVISSYKSESLALGIIEANEFSPVIRSFSLQNEQHLVFYSDGLTEQTSMLYEEFGKTEFDAAIGQCKRAEDLLDDLVNAFNKHSANTSVGDDVSVCCVNLGQLQENFVKHNSIEEDNKNGIVSCHIELQGDFIKNTDIVGLLDQLQKKLGMGVHLSQKSFTVISELVNNAVDHGVLGLKSVLKEDFDGFAEYLEERQERMEHLDVKDKINISIDFNQADNDLHFSIEDSGKGYAPNKIGPIKQYSLSGRGMNLIDRLCVQVTVEPPGNKTSVIIK